MSASYVVDLAGTTLHKSSIVVGSGSNLIIGDIVDLLNANTYTNVWVAGGAGGGSGAIEIRIQTSDGLTSGSFTDPTSGLPAGSLPVNVVSGGIIWANSGLWGSGAANNGPIVPINNAPMFCSGGEMFGAFQRPHRYARLIINSGAYPGAVTAGFIGQSKVTTSGTGSTQSPSSGTPTA